MSNGRILVMCPTRDRPTALRGAAASVAATSTSADFSFYVDDDQVELYREVLVDPGLRGLRGPCIGPARAANRLVEHFAEYAAYGLVTDDARVTTPGWDRWLLDTIDRFPNRIAILSPHHSHGNHVDMPFVSREWIDAVGWFAYPGNFHYCWPIISGLIGEMTGICHCPEGDFHIEHDYDENGHPERRKADAEAFFEFVALDLPATVWKVREAMSR